MQILTLRAIDAAEPLLASHRSSGGAAAAATHSGGSGRTHHRDSAPSRSKPLSTEDLQFRRRFRALLQLLRPWPALALALIAIGEAVVVAEVGKVAGSFYLIVLDGQPSRFTAAMARAAALYAASTVLYAVSSWVTERLALTWRRRLTGHLHHHYCQCQHAFYFLQQPGWLGQRPGHGEERGQERQEQKVEVGLPGQQDQQQQGKQEGEQGGSKAVDNPDQRIAADAAELCECLSAVARVAAAAPFKLLYYSWLTWGYLGWRGLVGVYIFFWLAAAVQRLAVAPVAHLVFWQERREGDLRFAHLRLREYAAEVAQYGAAAVERAHLDATLAAALVNQGRLVRWRAALAGTTRMIDYVGAMLNYFLVGAAVFSGFAGAATGGDSGRLAQFISNASFATLSLLYSFTELLDLSDQMSRLGGLTARVGQLLEALHGSAAPSRSSSSSRQAACMAADGDKHDLHAVRLSLDGNELQPSHFATLVQPPRMLSCLGGTVHLEASVHSLGSDLTHEAHAIFPDAPASGQLLACITFQFARSGLSLAPDRSSATLERAAAEMDRMLEAFLRWEAAVRAFLASQGCWCNSVDPRTGMALHGERAARWSEVAAAHALLGYERRDAGICPVVLHPTHGSGAYPVTLFTNAPPLLMSQALAAVADTPPPLLVPPMGISAVASSSGSAAPGSSGGGSGSQALLSLQGLSVLTAAGDMAVADLTLELHAGQHMLIAGPNGCGKSTLIKALSGLHPLAAGTAHLLGAAAAEGGVLFIPQRPLAAPGSALWQQLCYPGGSGSDAGSSDGGSSDGGSSEQQGQQAKAVQRAPDAELAVLLERVGLQYLLARVGGSFEAPADWAAMLSPGELQRLAVARVLHRRPVLAVLDEVTSAVSEEAARQLYAQLHADSITCISIGQDCTHLRHLHTLLLRLGCGPPLGAWELEHLKA